METATINQTTLANRVACSGVGLHSGKPVHLAILPARANTGIVFRRMDIAEKQSRVRARHDMVSDTRLGTTLSNRFGVEVATVEHLMAALWGAGIDNAVVELDGPEVPIMDGSSDPFMFMLECAGVAELAAPRRMIRILKAVEVKDGASVACVRPNIEGDEGIVFDVEIYFESPHINRQKARYDFRDVTFKQALSRARTFGFEHEVAALRSAGLALGGSLDNAIVVGKQGVINEEGLRYADEFIRHKALDCLGDLYLAGGRIDGHFTFTRPGHAINNKLLRAILADESAYAISAAGRIEPAFPALRPAAPAYA